MKGPTAMGDEIDSAFRDILARERARIGRTRAVLDYARAAVGKPLPWRLWAVAKLAWHAIGLSARTLTGAR